MTQYSTGSASGAYTSNTEQHAVSVRIRPQARSDVNHDDSNLKQHIVLVEHDAVFVQPRVLDCLGSTKITDVIDHPSVLL